MTLAGVLWAVLGGACLDPLSEPTSCEDPGGYVVGDECKVCPPPAGIPGGACVYDILAAIGGEYPPTQCLTASPLAIECLIGAPPPGTAQTIEEYAAELCSAPFESLPACYSDACPPVVTERVPGAVCFEPEGEPGWASLTERQLRPCMCRAPREIERCDGRGVVLAAYNGGMLSDDPPPRGDGVVAYLPSLGIESGSMGLYARVRGYAQPLVMGLSAAGTEDGDPVGYASVAYLNAAEFTDVLMFGSSSDGIPIGPDDQLTDEPFRWSDPAFQPKVIAVGASAEPVIEEENIDNASRRLYALEIDCMIPFYVPD